MARAVTLFTGQWADLSLADLAAKAADWGYDGLELACWGDHFEVDKALADDNYCKEKRALLDKHGLKVFAISTHLVGQAVCDNIDFGAMAIPRACRSVRPRALSTPPKPPRSLASMSLTALRAVRYGITSIPSRLLLPI